MRVVGKLWKCGFTDDIHPRLDITFRQWAGPRVRRGIGKSLTAVGRRKAGKISICLDKRRDTTKKGLQAIPGEPSHEQVQCSFALWH